MIPINHSARLVGFGEVFWGRNSAGDVIAVKKLAVSPDAGGHRELEVAAELIGKPYEHVVPVFDGGEDAEGSGYFVVMAKANASLDGIHASGLINAAQVAGILLQITNGLLEVGGLVHRDLKPGNILLHEGKWKIADFGIARFVEETTSTRTLKRCLSPCYAAPEHWREERSTHATDVYAMGCIAFFLLTGRPPFTSDPPNEHLYADVPSYECDEPRLRGLINMMLRKPAEGRPSLERVRTNLTNVLSMPQSTQSTALHSLAKVGAAVAEERSRRLVEIERLRQEKESRDSLVAPAIRELRSNLKRMFEKICSTAPEAKVNEDSETDLAIGLGGAVLACAWRPGETAIAPNAFRESRWDVVTEAQLWVTEPKRQLNWGASLWYARLPGRDDYRWHEVSYVTVMPGPASMPQQCVQHQKADVAVARTIMSSLGVAYGPELIDDEDEEKFHERWIELLALAAEGRLGYPAQYPVIWPLRFA
jgi:eukaryotic-like serine/threonine-protein kinase